MPTQLSQLSFAKLPYLRPNLADLRSQARRSRLILRIASNQLAAEKAIQDFDNALASFRTMAVIARIRHDQALDNPTLKQEQTFFDEAEAEVLQIERQVYQALLKSRHAAHMGELFGMMLLRRAENSDSLINARVVNLIADENKLASTYQTEMAEPAIAYDGKLLSLAQIEPFLQSPVREIRRTAHVAISLFFKERSERFDQIFDQLVVTRDRIARGLGLRRFTDLGYRRMERMDYGRAEVEALRDSVVRYIVPLTVEIRRLQRRRLGIDRMYHYDLPCLFPQGNPVCLIEPEKLAQTADKLFADLFGQTPSFFHSLSERGFLDLLARPNKTGGGYCTTVYDARLPFILMNASSTPQDVTTLMHEAGHACASITSFTVPRLSCCHQPSLDICEIHSTAMEYLTYPFMDRFFGEDAEDYTLMHMTEGLLFLPYGCMVDEFQHRIYDEPSLTSAQRHQIWRSLEEKYQPYLEYEADEYFAAGCAWHKKEHIFAVPFYYIDYCIAQLASLEIWMLSREKKGEAIKRYESLCQAGGSAPFGELLRTAGLSSPFSADTIKRIAYQACAFLAL